MSARVMSSCGNICEGYGAVPTPTALVLPAQRDLWTTEFASSSPAVVTCVTRQVPRLPAYHVKSDWQQTKRDSDRSHCCSSTSNAASSISMVATAAARTKSLCSYCDCEVSPTRIEEHEQICKYESTWCENKCGQLVQRQLVDSHASSECPKRLVLCMSCKKKFVCETLQMHQSNCPRLFVTCPVKCDASLTMPREEVDKHLEHCPSIHVQCAFKDVGCTFKGPRHELDQHLLEGTVKHLSLACGIIGRQKQEIKTLQSLVEASQNTTGELYWKITEHRSKLAECRSAAGSPGVELISPPFYTSVCGYKLVASAFLDGNGSGEGEYLSLYIKVLPGEFDHVLEWPFPLGVTFTVFDQCPRIGRINISESFGPDPTWKHFQKPARGASACGDGQPLGFGYPRFASHTELRTRSYLRDDSLLIRVRVDGAKCPSPP